jgi:signal transduction histidine kinase
MYFTTSIAVVAGLCLALGILYAFVGLRRPADRLRNLLFAFFALAYAGAILTARAAFLADGPDQFITAIRVSWVFASIGFSLLIWYVAAYTEFRPRLFLWVITGAFAVIGLASVFFPDLLFDASASVSSITLPWGETVLELEAGEGALFPLVLLSQFAMIAYIIAADVVQFRRGSRRDAAALAIGIGWFVFTIVEEALATSGVVDFVVLADFGFLGFVLAMSVQMVNGAIETEQELLDYRANLESMVEDRTAQLEEAQTQLLAQAEQQATVAERSRLARDLHDVVTQLLFSINLVAGSLPRLWRSDPDMAERSTNELQRLTRGALAEMRTLLRELRPQTIADTDLGTLVTQLSEGLAARHDIPAEIRAEVNGNLPPEVHIALYRIAQEAMNNVAKHANASSLIVDLTGGDGHVHLSVADDGYGFDAAEVSAGSMGLEIMRERASGIGAELAVSSQPDAGTTVEVTWINADISSSQ